MTEINFTSTYRIPITQAGINPAKKEKLRELVSPYPNKLVSKSNTGTVRISIPDEDDAKFIKNLKAIGYKIFQIFEGEDIRRGKLDEYIKDRLALGEYQQIGKQKKRLSTSAKQKRFAKVAEKERREELKILAEVKEEVRQKRLAQKEADKPADSNPYFTDFDFEEFEIK